MKIVQTLYNFSDGESVIYNSGGWLSAEYHWFSWALSCLQLRKYYAEVALYADTESKRLLIDIFQLPYTEVTEISLPKNPKNAWALVKIYTQFQQTEPYLHVDGDVYIWKAFEEELLKKPLICQNIELNFPFYPKILDDISRAFTYLPDYFVASAYQNFNACNAGIIGGNDVTFLHQYAKEAFNFIEKNKSSINSGVDDYFCMVFEQLLFYRMAIKEDITVHTFLLPINDPEYGGLSDLHTVPYGSTYIHLMGRSKKKTIP